VGVTRHIILEMAAASREQEMWERRFKVLYAQHPIWRTADNDGSWGLRDFLNYAGEVCGFAPASVDTLPKGQDAKQGLAGTEGSAVPKADAQTQPGTPHDE
jgi:hypothetical protein